MKKFMHHKIILASFRIFILFLFIFLITRSFTYAQIILIRDTTLTGSHTFEQGIGAYDPNVFVRIENANIFFMQGMDIEYAHLSVRNSQLYFYNGFGLTISRNGVFEASNDCRFQAGDDPVGISLWKCRAFIIDCRFKNVSISVMETWENNLTITPTFKIENSEVSLDGDDNNPMIFSQGVNMKISNCSFHRVGDFITGQHPNIHLQSNKYTIIEDCYFWDGGISAGSILNSEIEILNNKIYRADKGISFWGVNKIIHNKIEVVDVGLEGGTVSNKLQDVIIQNNEILNVAVQAIDLVGENISITKNIISGNGETGKGVKLTYSSGNISNNLITNFKIKESSSSNDGTAMYVKNSISEIEIHRNTIKFCGLHETASKDIVSSIVYLDSKVNFANNELRNNTLGGVSSQTNSYNSGTILDIICKGNNSPSEITNNLIINNDIEGSGVYEPTNTSGTLVSIDFDRKVNFNSNILWGATNNSSLGLALFPNFSGGIVGDSLVFEENTFKENLVGVGVMQTPDLSGHNTFSDNKSYNIVRLGYAPETLYALSNNWGDDDPVNIDNKLFDDEEGNNLGPIDFGYYYTTDYKVDIMNTEVPLINEGQELEIIAEVKKLDGTPEVNKHIFFSSSNPEVAMFTECQMLTDNEGRGSGIITAISGGSTLANVYVGDMVSESFQINVEEITSVKTVNIKLAPEDFMLYSNYPNPFNPTTKISYSIKNQSYVSLKVFDVLGREVSVLVNKEQLIGNYTFEYDATDLTSGVYFYRIQAGDFVETKKMVLMK